MDRKKFNTGVLDRMRGVISCNKVALGESLGVSKQAINNYYAGKRRLGLEPVVFFAKESKTSIDYLIWGEEGGDQILNDYRKIVDMLNESLADYKQRWLDSERKVAELQEELRRSTGRVRRVG